MTIYNATESGLVAPSSGEIRVRITATTPGTVSIDEHDGSGYVGPTEDLTWTTETSQIVSLEPDSTYRLTITGGTAVAVSIVPYFKGRL